MGLPGFPAQKWSVRRNLGWGWVAGWLGALSWLLTSGVWVYLWKRQILHPHHIFPIVAVQLLSCVQLFVTPWTWLCCPWDFPGKNTGVGCHFLLQGIFWTQGSNSRLLHWQAGIFLPSEPPGKPITYIWKLAKMIQMNLFTKQKYL